MRGSVGYMLYLYGVGSQKLSTWERRLTEQIGYQDLYSMTPSCTQRQLTLQLRQLREGMDTAWGREHCSCGYYGHAESFMDLLAIYPDNPWVHPYASDQREFDKE